MRFKKNESFKDEQGNKIEILDLLGEGGQGIVYLVSYEGKQYALKCYLEKVSSDFKFNLKNNISKGSPSKNFLWPKKIFDFKDGTIGYIMDLREKEYCSFIKYLNGNVQFKDRYTLISWCIELCMSFKELHVHGFSYQDLNDGSFFLNSETGELLICDNDNVTADKNNLGILGKMKYMAPEIVRGDKNPKTKESRIPDMHTDRFSLAVILFLTFCLGNPFEGENLKKYNLIDGAAELELYGTNPVFVYNKNDLSNRPIRGYHTALLRRWPVLPTYMKEAFHRTFVEGLTDRENGRTTEIEWIKLLSKYRDELITCSCGSQHMIGLYEKKKTSVCPYCNKLINDYCVLQINKQQVVLEPGKMIFANHLDKYSSNYNTSFARVCKNKKNQELWGIKLQLKNDVEVKDSTGNVKVIGCDKVIPIIENLKIKFSDDTIAQIKKL